jgi:superoxide oxidase
MGWRNSNERYGSLSIGLHWIMLALIAAVYALMELRGIFPRGSEGRDTMKALHYMLGLSVLFLALLRLALAVSSPSPRIRPDPPAVQKAIAKLMHGALYALMIGMPVLGWLILSSEGDQIPFFGLHLPALIGPNEAFKEPLEEIHETFGNVGYFLIGLHAAAALFHHHFVHDDTLKRMLPGNK